jgi:hypothetical protein
MRATQAQREDVVAERAAFLGWLDAVDAVKVKAVDESGVVQGMRLAYGYAPRGERLVSSAPLRQGKRLSLLGWLGFDGTGAVTMQAGTAEALALPRVHPDAPAAGAPAGRHRIVG